MTDVRNKVSAWLFMTIFSEIIFRKLVPAFRKPPKLKTLFRKPPVMKIVPKADTYTGVNLPTKEKESRNRISDAAFETKFRFSMFRFSISIILCHNNNKSFAHVLKILFIFFFGGLECVGLAILLLMSPTCIFERFDSNPQRTDVAGALPT